MAYSAVCTGYRGLEVKKTVCENHEKKIGKGEEKHNIMDVVRCVCSIRQKDVRNFFSLLSFYADGEKDHEKRKRRSSSNRTKKRAERFAKMFCKYCTKWLPRKSCFCQWIFMHAYTTHPFTFFVLSVRLFFDSSLTTNNESKKKLNYRATAEIENASIDAPEQYARMHATLNISNWNKSV